MAAINLEDKLVIEYRLLVSTQRVEDLSDPQDETSGENTDRTEAFARMAGAKIRSKFDVGLYDDTDHTIGDLAIVDLGVRWMHLTARGVFQLIEADQEERFRAALIEEMDDLVEARIREGSTPVSKAPDNTTLNNRYKSSTWESEIH